MDRYLVISPHSAGECKQALKEVNATGYITRFDWGCMDGDHTGCVVLEAEGTQQALMVIPSMQRHNAKAIKLVKFSPADVVNMH
jgi:hypothetical protein